MTKANANASTTPVEKVENVTASAAAPTASGASLPNADAKQIAADHYLERLRGDAETIRKGLQDIGETDAAKAGQKAYLVAKSALGSLQPSINDMLVWFPGSTDDAFERAVNTGHMDVDPDTSAAAYKMVSEAMQLALCASDPGIAKEARMGASRDPAKPQFKFVQVPDMVPPGTPSDKVKGAYVGDQSTAKAAIDAKLGAAKEATAKELWTKARDAVDNVVKLRRLGSDLASLGMRKSRWRRNLYVGACQQYLDDYAAKNPAIAVGKVWSDACGRAAAAHGKYMNDSIKTGAKSEELLAAIKAAVWTDFLEPKLEVQGRKMKSEDEELNAAVKAMWKALDNVDKLVTGAMVAGAIDDHIKAMVKFGRVDVAETIQRPAVKQRQVQEAENAEAEARAKAEVGEEAEAEEVEASQEESERAEARKAQAKEAEAVGPAKRKDATKVRETPQERLQRINAEKAS